MIARMIPQTAPIRPRPIASTLNIPPLVPGNNADKNPMSPSTTATIASVRPAMPECTMKLAIAATIARIEIKLLCGPYRSAMPNSNARRRIAPPGICETYVPGFSTTLMHLSCLFWKIL